MKQGGKITEALKKLRGELQAKNQEALKKAQTEYDAALAAFAEVESEEGSAKYIQAKDRLDDARTELSAVKKNETPELKQMAADVDDLVADAKAANVQYDAFRRALGPLAKAAGVEKDAFFEETNKRFIAGEFDLEDVPEEPAEIAAWVQENIKPKSDGKEGKKDGEKGDGKGGKKKAAGDKTPEEMESEVNAEGEAGGGAARGGGEDISEEDKKNLDSMTEKTRLGIGGSFSKEELEVFVRAAKGDFGGEPLTTDELGEPVVSDELPASQVSGFAPPSADQQRAMQEHEESLAASRAEAESKASGKRK